MIPDSFLSPLTPYRLKMIGLQSIKKLFSTSSQSFSIAIHSPTTMYVNSTPSCDVNTKYVNKHAIFAKTTINVILTLFKTEMFEFTHSEHFMYTLMGCGG